MNWRILLSRFLLSGENESEVITVKILLFNTVNAGLGFQRYCSQAKGQMKIHKNQFVSSERPLDKLHIFGKFELQVAQPYTQ